MIVAMNLTHFDSQSGNGGEGKERLQIKDIIKTSKVPVLKMKDSMTDIEFDISQGCQSVSQRHVQICKQAQQVFEKQNFRSLYLSLKFYLATRDCNKSFTGGVSSFVLFYMVLAFY